MDEEVKEYNIDGVIVRVHGGQPDRKRLEEAMQKLGRALIEQGFDLDKVNAGMIDI